MTKDERRRTKGDDRRQTTDDRRLGRTTDEQEGPARRGTMIEIKQLTKTYGGNVQALRGVDLNIGAGMFGLVGPNGAGKTTLMRILAGLVRPTSGAVRVFGHDVTTP